MWFDLVVLMTVFRAFQFLFRRRRNRKDGSDAALKLKVATTFQAAYGGSVFQALRIPDTGQRSHQVIEAALLTDRELFVFGVLNWSGVIRTSSDGHWVETDSAGNITTHPNPVTLLQEKAEVLSDYIVRRGVTLPREFIKIRAVFVNAYVRPDQEILLLPGVVSYDGWEDIGKKGSLSAILGIESNISMPSSSKKPADSLYLQLRFILGTAPTWDRLELRGGGIVFGEFIKFKGPSDDLKALDVAKRSRISQYEAIHPWSMWNFIGINMNSDVKVICTLRDYRQGLATQPDRVDIHVKGDVEIIFQLEGTSKPHTYCMNEIEVLALRA